jgi:hypothetical protein
LASRQRGAGVLGVFAAALMAVVGTACGVAPPEGVGGAWSDEPDATGAARGRDNSNKVAVGRCAQDGEVRDCHLLIGDHGDVVNCFYGQQSCTYGVWSECREGHFSFRYLGQSSAAEDGEEAAEGIAAGEQAVAPLGQAHTLAATIGPCNDKCDPTCTRIQETPGTVLTGTPVANWAQPTLNSLDGAKPVIGSLWPSTCQAGTDCQFHMFCQDPRNNAACTGPSDHDKCAVGAPLSTACKLADPCVAAVCAQNPNCCQYAGPCAHSPCQPGAAMTCGADASASAVCAAAGYGYCCDTSAGPGWDHKCTQKYGQIKGVACPTDYNRAWDSPQIDPAVGSKACTQLVHDACGVECLNGQPICDHDPCFTGSGLTPGCDTDGCVAKVCAANSACCGATGTWSAACVNQMAVSCGKACTGPRGVCSAMLPNYVDVACNGPDLTITLACHDTSTPLRVPGNTVNGQGYVVVCNNGTQDTSGTVTVDVYGPNATLPVAWPGAPTLAHSCAAPSVITPGKCVDVVCATNPNDLVKVRMTPAVGKPAECNTSNNWSVNADSGTQVTCDAPWCSARSSLMRSLRTQFVVMAESSAFMTGPEWTAIKSALSGFIDEFSNAALPWPYAGNQAGVFSGSPLAAVGVFPGGSALCNTTSCGGGATDCMASTWTSIAASTGLVAGGTSPATVSGNPPYYQALKGALEYARLRAVTPQMQAAAAPVACTPATVATACAAVPGCGPAGPSCSCQNNVCQPEQWNEAVLFIFGSDINAHSYCTNNTVASIAGLAAQYYGTYGIRTFAIAVGSAPKAAADAIGLAGGGRGFWVNTSATNLNTYLEQSFLYANQACSFSLPSTALFDMTNICPAGKAASGGGAGGSACTAASQCQSNQCDLVAGKCVGANCTGAAIQGGNTLPAGYSPGGYVYAAHLVPTACNTTCTVGSANCSAGGTCNASYGDCNGLSADGCETKLTGANNYQSGFSSYLEACLATCSASAGSLGWCYDDAQAPTRMVLCPETCKVVSFDPYGYNALTPAQTASAWANYTLSCPMDYGASSSVGSMYTASACDGLPGTKPLWSYLGYDTFEAPYSNTSVSFAFATADRDNAGNCPAAAASYTKVLTPGTAVPMTVIANVTDPQVCQVGGPPGCPVDLVAAAQQGTLTGPMLADCMDLTVTMNPNPQRTSTPTLNSFELRYSCVPAE